MNGTLTDDVAPFDAWARTYDRHWSQRILFRRVHAEVLTDVRRSRLRPARILDVGSGTGELLMRLGRLFPAADLVGADPAPGMAERAREKAAGVKRALFVDAGAGSLPFPEASFDLVVSTSSFHHWDDQMEGLRQVRLVLAPGGVLILADGYRGRLPRPRLGVLPRLLADHHDDPERFHHPARLQAMMEAAGLVVTAQRRPPALAGTILVTRARRVSGVAPA